MAWNGRFGDDEEGSGLELSLGLPGYFSRSPATHAAGGLEKKGTTGGSAARAKGGNGFKARPAAAAPVVGWPPVRAFRRNLASLSSSSKRSQEPPPSSHHGGAGGKAVEAGKKKGQFVKVNMDGVPIGRKVDLSAHAGYDTLSAAVDHLFRGLLAAQTSSAGGDQAAAAAAAGILNGRGEYTLVYEDDEGDQMLVGDVPWAMFIAAARRLRVLRSADLSPSSLRGRKRAATGC